ncbi:MAG: hypothetical protein M1833_004035 [Piccolia ochrophora]|nr:MAG: hypothetical protein M1833_004035 [Piccolia ochrophora]
MICLRIVVLVLGNLLHHVAAYHFGRGSCTAIQKNYITGAFHEAQVVAARVEEKLRSVTGTTDELLRVLFGTEADHDRVRRVFQDLRLMDRGAIWLAIFCDENHIDYLANADPAQEKLYDRVTRRILRVGPLRKDAAGIPYTPCDARDSSDSRILHAVAPDRYSIIFCPQVMLPPASFNGPATPLLQIVSNEDRYNSLNARQLDSVSPLSITILHLLTHTALLSSVEPVEDRLAFDNANTYDAYGFGPCALLAHNSDHWHHDDVYDNADTYAILAKGLSATLLTEMSTHDG